MNTTIITIIATYLDPAAFCKAERMTPEERRFRKREAKYRTEALVGRLRNAGYDICTTEERRVLDSLP